MGNAVLVTGGAGFIGSHLVDALLAQGHAVRVVDNFSTGSRDNLAHCLARISLLEGDVGDPDIALAACRDVEYVFHQAAIPSVPRSVKDPFSTQRAGEIATLRLLDACAAQGVKRIMYAASSSAYGDAPGLPRAETMPPAPMSPYAASKLACEYYVRAYAHCRGLDGVCLRYFNIFGPRQDPDSPYSAVIALFLKLMRQGQAPHIHGDGEQTRDFTYVVNVVHANLLAMRVRGPLNGQAINVGCGERSSLNALVAALNDALGTSLTPTYGPPRAGDVAHSLADISRARELLGYVPRVPFPEGIRRLAAACPI
ncbi:MAG: SDR family oxidoreductase [Planctomycetota bacterium]|nr:SDR family oxidoreductase [Planctomycetota bacterium]